MAYPGSDPTAFQHAVVDVHGSYRAKRLTHEPPDELISDVVTARTWRPHAMRSGFFFSLLVIMFIFNFFLAIIAALAEAAAQTGIDSDGGGGFWIGLLYLMFVLQLIVVVAWIVALFIPLREPIAEYGLLIEGRAPAYAVSYWWVMNTAHARQAPFQAQFARLKGLPILLLANGRERGLVVVHPVGTDLFVGWTMWRARSTVVLIGHMFRDMFQTGLHSDIRAASSRALRELIHSVTREGIQAAILHPPVPDETARAQIEQLPNLDAPTGPIVTGIQQPVSAPPQQSATGQGYQPSYSQQQYPSGAPSSGPPSQ